MCVSLKKFIVSVFVKYGGFMLKSTPNAEVQIMADQNRIDYILKSPPPTSKVEVQSFMGLLNTLHVWSRNNAGQNNTLKELGP